VDNSLSAPFQNRAVFERKRKLAAAEELAVVKTAKLVPGELMIPANRYPLTTMEVSSNRSWTWNHFKIITVKVGPDDVRHWAETHASCNICHARALTDDKIKWAIPFTAQRSPGHLTRHLVQFHNEILVEKRVALAVYQQQGKCITSFFKKHPHFEEAYLKWAVDTFQPLNSIEGDRFRKMCKTLSEDAPVMTSEKVMGSLLQKEQNIKQEFCTKMDGEYVSMTLNHWTSNGKVAFVAQTAHFIDKDMKLQKFTLACLRDIPEEVPEMILNL
jgi:hypothetical protein